MKSYDNIGENESILLDLPFTEGTGAVTYDLAKPHHQTVTLVNTPTWEALASGLGVLTFNGTNQYAELAAASCADLDFTTGDFSIGVWFKWTACGLAQMLLGRYGTNLDGWEVFVYESGTLNTVTLRHNHASLTPNESSSCYSSDWTPGTWAFLGISRESGGIFPIHYRNAEVVTMSYESTGMLDIETCNRDLVIGTRYTKNTNWFKGSMWRPRVWNRALSQDEWLRLFEAERDWFGV